MNIDALFTYAMTAVKAAGKAPIKAQTAMIDALFGWSSHCILDTLKDTGGGAVTPLEWEIFVGEIEWERKR